GRTAAVFDELAFGDTIRRDLPAVLFGEDEDSPEEQEPGAEVLELEGAAELHDLLAEGTGPLALTVADDVRGGPMLGIATGEARAVIRLERLDSDASAALAAALDGPREIRAADVPAVRSWLQLNGYPLGQQARDLALEAFVLRPGARSYEAEALGTELGGTRFAPRPRKPADSTLAKETPEVRSGHIAVAGARLAEAAAALHPAAVELARRQGEEPWAVSILEDLERPLQ